MQASVVKTDTRTEMMGQSRFQIKGFRVSLGFGLGLAPQSCHRRGCYGMQNSDPNGGQPGSFPRLVLVREGAAAVGPPNLAIMPSPVVSRVRSLSMTLLGKPRVLPVPEQ